MNKWQHIPYPQDLITMHKTNPCWWLRNSADPVEYNSWYKPTSPSWLRHIYWWLRNPAENFFRYVIGIRDKEFTRYGNYPSMMFNPNGGFTYAFIKYKYFILPFISYWNKRRRFQFYIGWRESGSFGFALRFNAEGS